MSASFDTARWPDVERIFGAVADLPLPEQASAVTRLCAGDTALEAEVRRLLAHDRGSGVRIASVLDAVAQLPATAAGMGVALGRQVGAYHLVREIGRGGMGVVYEGIRDDAFRQRVALKMATTAVFSPDLALRFADERQILARLTHPRIARLLDGGTTDDGVPWFAMEFVDGVAIHTHVSSRRLTVASRLRLFLQVCDAVEYAHQNLVVHRDLKPANILVTTDGVRLLDFGIAKLLQEAGDAAATVTAGGAAPITPDYGSPEQVKGEPITTRTDVYALGLVLAEILTGVKAQVADTTSPLSLVHSICEIDVPLPSAASGLAPGIARQLRGDLDTIVRTATKKDPARRYPSVAALADDIRRHLDGRPIVARQDSAAYRASRFLRRYWLQAGSAAALLVTLAGGIVATQYQARQAERRFQQVRGIANALMNDVHGAIRDLASSTQAQEVVLKTAVEYLDGLAREAGNDRALQLEIARGYLKAATMAYSQEHPSLGRRDERQRYADRAASLLKPLAPAARLAPDIAVVLLESYRVSAEIAFEASRRDEAMQILKRGVAIGEAALATAPRDRAMLQALHDQLTELISTFSHDAEVVAKVPLLVEVSERLLAAAATDVNAQANVGVAYSQAGNVALAQGDVTAADRYYTRSSEIHRRIIAANPDNSTARRNLMIVQANHGDVALGPLGTASYTGAGGPPAVVPPDDLRRALAAYAEACAQADWRRSKDPANDAVLLDYAVCRGRMAPAYPAGDGAAIAQLDEVLRLVRDLAGRTPGRISEFEIEFRGSLAERYRQAGRVDRAEGEWARIEAIVRQGLAKDPKEYYLQRLAIPPLENRAHTMVALGRLDEARRAMTRVEQLADAVSARADVYARGPGWPPRVRAWHAALYERMGDPARAAAARAEALESWRAVAARTDLPDDVAQEAKAAVGSPASAGATVTSARGR